MNKNIKLFKFYFNFKKNIIILIKKIYTPQIIKKYFIKNKIIKLHLGCGGRVFDGWLNCDINLQADCYLDLNKTLLFKNNSVDYIYSEHVLEHFSYNQCKKILQECYRVLKPCGIIRTAMPSLDFYLENMFNNENQEIKDFIAWHKENFQELKDLPNNMYSIINFIIGSCGHKYVYTEQTFTELLSELNFKNIKQVQPGKSEFSELNNLETDLQGRQNNLNLNVHLAQTMSIEAQKC